MTGPASCRHRPRRPRARRSTPMRVRWLGRVPYREAWALQRAISRRSTEDYLLLLEHPPVYTLGRNGDLDHVLVDPASVGAELVPVDRGGDVTYHGPGQLIGYPLLTVGPGPHQGRAHVHRVEQVVIDALVSLGMAPSGVGRLEAIPGVWVGLDEDPGPGGTGPRKIAAIGVRTSRGPHHSRLRAQRRYRPLDVRPHRAVRDRRPSGHLVGCRGPDLHGPPGRGGGDRRSRITVGSGRGVPAGDRRPVAPTGHLRGRWPAAPMRAPSVGPSVRHCPA